MAKVVYQTEPARVDADGTAKPLSAIVGHAGVNERQGPGIDIPDTYRDESGNSIALKARNAFCGGCVACRSGFLASCMNTR